MVMQASRWLKRGIYVLLLVLVAAPAAVFALLNRGDVHLDLAFAEVVLSKPLAFTVAFGLGWFFGLLCVGGALVKRRANAKRTRQDSKGTAPTTI